MLRYIHARDLPAYRKLHQTMFADRARQFHARLGWDVAVNERGEERDQYDDLDPLYVIWEMPDGSHGGSMRFLPTTGRTMAAEHFPHLSQGRRIASPLIWECTRFCISDRAGADVSAALMLGGAEVGLGFGLSHALGVFDARMVRIYRRLGWPPMILGSEGQGREKTSLGLWAFGRSVRERLLRRAGISDEVSRQWFMRAFGHLELMRAAS